MTHSKYILKPNCLWKLNLVVLSIHSKPEYRYAIKSSTLSATNSQITVDTQIKINQETLLCIWGACSIDDNFIWAVCSIDDNCIWVACSIDDFWAAFSIDDLRWYNNNYDLFAPSILCDATSRLCSSCGMLNWCYVHLQK